MSKVVIDESLLRHLYIDQEKAINKIASELNVSVGKVFNDLKKYGIETRKYLTEEQKNAISNANKGRVSPRKGKHLSEEARKKISERLTLKGAGHKKVRKDGYIALYYPSHPRSNKEGYIMEHVYLMEKHIGRPLKSDEVVHHKNHKRDDNRIDNLQVMTFKEHCSLHMRERWANKKGVKTYQ